MPFLSSFRLDINAFERQLGAAAGTDIFIIPQYRLLRRYRPHVESAVNLLAEIQEHVTLTAVDFFRHG